MTIIILHGWMQNKNNWSQLSSQLKGVSGVNKVYPLDLPGFGEEKLISNSWGIPEYSKWVDQRIKKLKLNNVIIIGHSFGGRITSYLASQKPSYLKAIVLSGSPSIYRPNIKTKIKNKTFRFIKSSLGITSLTKNFYSPELLNAKERGLDIIFKKAVIFDQTNELPKIAVPSLLIWGENDASVPLSIAHEINSLIKGSKLEIIKNGEHNSFASQPYLFFGYVKKFIEGL